MLSVTKLINGFLSLQLVNYNEDNWRKWNIYCFISQVSFTLH